MLADRLNALQLPHRNPLHQARHCTLQLRWGSREPVFTFKRPLQPACTYTLRFLLPLAHGKLLSASDQNPMTADGAP